MSRTGVALAAVAAALVVVPGALADTAAEDALAQRHAPVVRLVEQPEECGPGEPYEPTDVELLFGDPTVALRGPWLPSDLVKIAPEADDLVGRYEHHLDFPGNALDPGCDYERWASRLTEGAEPAVYAHVATESAKPGKLALQYWLFYPFNDFNNTHEGDWEMIQLVFDADDAADALGEEPTLVGYSSHEGAESARWDDEKLEVVDGTHPVVYPGAGSHANKYTAALYLGNSAEAGVGCDDTRGPHDDLRPVVRTIPSDPDEAARAFPWIAFEGRWGELQKAFFNGPTGPNMKEQWTEPITWSEGWRDRSYAVPSGGILGTGATDFFCAAVERGSGALVRLLRSPGATLTVLGALLALVVLVAWRVTWTPTTPLRAARRRSWGQVVTASGRMYARSPRTFLGIGALLIPVAFAITFLQWLLFRAFDLIGLPLTGESAGSFAVIAVAIGAAFTLLGLAFVQAATALALVELDAGRRVPPLRAYALALPRSWALLRASVVFVAAWLLLTASTLLVPVAIWLAVRWSLVAPVVALEGRYGLRALGRSGELVRGRWWRVASLVGAAAVVVLITGPLLGALLILTTPAPLALLNVVAGLVYAVAMPFVALVTTYVYADARVHEELAPAERPGELPAEIVLSA